MKIQEFLLPPESRDAADAIKRSYFESRGLIGDHPLFLTSYPKGSCPDANNGFVA